MVEQPTPHRNGDRSARACGSGDREGRCGRPSRAAGDRCSSASTGDRTTVCTPDRRSTAADARNRRSRGVRISTTVSRRPPASRARTRGRAVQGVWGVHRRCRVCTAGVPSISGCRMLPSLVHTVAGPCTGCGMCTGGAGCARAGVHSISGCRMLPSLVHTVGGPCRGCGMCTGRAGSARASSIIWAGRRG